MVVADAKAGAHARRVPAAAFAAGARWLRAMARDPLLVLACLALAVVVVWALGADFVAPYDPNAQNLANRLAPPFAPREGVSFLGADALGRDMLSRIIHGSRVSLAVALAAVLVAGTI